MKKKILSVLLSLCMVLTLMPAASGIAWAESTSSSTATSVTIGSAQLNKETPYYVNNEAKASPAEGETWSAYFYEGTLELKGLTARAKIEASGNLTIKLNGVNSLGNAEFGSQAIMIRNGNLTITGSGKLIAENKSNAATTVYADENITVNGGAQVEVTKDGNSAQAIHAERGDITISEKASVKATNKGSGSTDTSDTYTLLAHTIKVSSGATLEVISEETNTKQAIKGTVELGSDTFKVLTGESAASAQELTEISENKFTNDAKYVKVETTESDVTDKTFSFSYAYDVDRDPAYPTKGQEVEVTIKRTPIGSEKSDGSWTLTKVGKYGEFREESTYLPGIVKGIVKKYSTLNLKEDAILIYELKQDGKHIAYGIIVAYNEEEGYALFQGDSWSGSGGAGYYLSNTTRTNGDKFSITANFDITDFMEGNSISLDTTGKYVFAPAVVGYSKQNAKKVIITKKGEVGDLSVAISGNNANAFTASAIENDSEGNTYFNVETRTGLEAGEYKATVVVSGTNIIASQSFDVTFTVKASNILVSPAELAFAEVTVGYSTVDAKTVEVKNNGNAATGELNVVLAGNNAQNFTLTKTESDFNIDAGKTANFTVKPKDGLAAGTYNAVVEISGTGIAKTIPVSFTVKAASSGGSYHPTIQKPTIITDDGADATLNYYGDKLTIKAKDGYDLADVLLNGVSKGKVTEVTGLRTGDKVEVKTAKKQEEPQKPTKEEIIAGVNGSRLVARSRLITLDNGKKAIRITWYDKAGMEVNFDGVEVYRSLKKNKGYGKKAFYETKDGQYEGYYINTKNLKEGTRYYYKVRGYVVLDGQKYFTEYSYKAFRTVK